MDRVAFRNMTSKNRKFTVGDENTGKSKINVNMSDYFLERQSKNMGDYNEFVSAFNNNISEDKCRSDVNNDMISNHQPEQVLDRVYHPTLLTDQERQFHNADRCGLSVGTREHNHVLNGLAINKNNKSSSVMTPLPKLNYPHGYDQIQPLEMDMSSQLESQFGGLVDDDMERQISALTTKFSEKPETTEPTVQLKCGISPSYTPFIISNLDHCHKRVSDSRPKTQNTSSRTKCGANCVRKIRK